MAAGVLAASSALAATAAGARWALVPAARPSQPARSAVRLAAEDSADDVTDAWASKMSQTGCENWEDILLDYSNQDSEELCGAQCQQHKSCIGYGYQFSDDGCDGKGNKGLCYLWHGQCKSITNSCWDDFLLNQPQSGENPARWVLQGSGCSNWRDIKIGAYSVEDSVEACGERCAGEAGCISFNYQVEEIGECNGDKESPGKGTCFVYNGACHPKQDGCWKLFAMNSPDSEDGLGEPPVVVADDADDADVADGEGESGVLETTLFAAVQAAETVLEVKELGGFGVGDKIKLESIDSDEEEDCKVASLQLGSMTLNSPLTNSYPVGAKVTLIEKSVATPAPPAAPPAPTPEPTAAATPAPTVPDDDGGHGGHGDHAGAHAGGHDGHGGHGDTEEEPAAETTAEPTAEPTAAPTETTNTTAATTATTATTIATSTTVLPSTATKVTTTTEATTPEPETTKDADDAAGEVFDPYNAENGDSEATRSFLQWVAHPDKCCTMDADAGGKKEAPASADECEEGSTEQHWMIPAGTGPITSAKQSGLCLTVEGAENADGTAVVVSGCVEDGPDQQWVVPGSGTGQIKWATNQEMCLDVQEQDEGSAEIPGLVIWTCRDGDRQQWHIAKASAVAQAG